MKRLARIAALLLLLLPLSCVREAEMTDVALRYAPKGSPVTLNLRFGVPDWYEVKIGTKAEVARTDEARIRDLYVLIFDENGDKFYGRYFTYEHLNNNLADLDEHSNEGWYVENSENSRGVVKIATRSEENCTLVLLANVANTIASLDHKDAVDVLSGIRTFEDLEDVRVTLEQEVVNRGDLFLMMDKKTGVNTGDLTWGEFDESTPVYDMPGGKYQLKLKAIDAKVKFLIKYNETNIDPAKCDARKWWVYNLPSECFLIPRAEQASDITYFDTQKAFFEGEVYKCPDCGRETNDAGSCPDCSATLNGPYQEFSFYMLENLQDPKVSIESLGTPDYYLREKETNPGADEGTYIYAPEKGTYVKFDMLLGLTTAGIQNATGNSDANHALTSEAVYTVHLGNFLDSRSNQSHDFDNYDVERGSSYTYFVTINGSRSIYVEVLGPDGNGNQREDEPGHEGSLMLSTDDIVNCDAHYEYHCLTFRYTPGLQGKKVSWYVKTPFDEGGANWIPDDSTPDPNDGDWEFNCKDYLWVKFGLNTISGGTYSHNRVSYPGDTYDVDWDHENDALAANQLLDIHQLYNYILDQTKTRNQWLEEKAAYAAGTGPDPGAYSGAFMLDTSLSTGEEDDDETTWVDESHEYVIRMTAFIDEYYYEKDPTLNPDTAPADPDLWRQFVNADPRELHILSEAVYSDDDQSDVIKSSHSIIQRSIQTFYNIYSPDLRTLWGTEHVDEMEYRIRHEKDPSQTVWRWWPSGESLPTSARPNNEENGRINTAAIWGVAPKSTWDENTAPEWEGENGFLDYTVDNNTPELRSAYQALAYSCLTRNRDNNGNGVIDPDEIRWYIAAVNQIIGMWVGNESLSPSARIYQPVNKNDITSGLNWRSWVVSSTISGTAIENPRTIRAEEGCTKSDYNFYNWVDNPAFDEDKRHQVSSVRCVRNIGTYNEGGVVTDISFSDYDQPIDNYYESPAGLDGNGKVRPNQDGTYTLRFSRLDPRSLREYTSVDLPYHEEYSMHNRVYLELNMQNPSNRVYTDGTGEGSIAGLSLDEEDINNDITDTGHNTYCPYGYRMPNMTEMLLMVGLQPSSYWTNNKMYPCRTYFSRGKLGSNVTTGEHDKIGWGYSSSTGRFHILDDDSKLTGLRCVRDNNCTGEITGSISVPGGEYLHMGDNCNIKLNITSMGSAIKSLSLSLVYVNTGGVETTEAIPTNDVKLSGVAIQDEVVPWTVPNNLTLLGNMSIRAVVVNNAGTQKILEAPIRVLSPVFASVRLLPCQYDNSDNPSFPVLLTASAPAPATITSWRLSIKDPDKEVESIALPADGRDSHYWSGTFDFDYTMSDLITGTYTFQIEVVTSDGYHTRSNTASMDVLHVNETWNKTYGEYDTDDDGVLDQIPWTHSWWQTLANANAWHNSLPVYDEVASKDFRQKGWISEVYPAEQVTDIDFFKGDFVEANLDVSNCTFIKTVDGNLNSQPQKSQVIGLDNIFSFGRTSIDWQDGALHFYYPAHLGAGDDQLQIDPVLDGYSKLYCGSLDGKLLLLLDRNGIKENGTTLTFSDEKYTSVVNSLINSTSLLIGAQEGDHRSRARYCFVRVVHNSEESNAAGGTVGFDNDPQNGGSL